MAQPTARGDSAERAAARAALMETAFYWLSQGNLHASEAVLFQDVRSRIGSLERDIECATKLIHIAVVLRERSDYDTANIIAERALWYLNEGRTNRSAGASPRRRAQTYELAGFIHEQLLFDSAAAKVAFTQAQSLMPTSKASEAGLKRLRDAEEKILRIGGRG